ncbi:hypothetical protein TUM12370_34080 [Salmonella enterica subsp. enterica serovar Choleraesuis]|nr:hypothetical protein TUM12370_34080 [Salmonella enterica subsp. enterica serovar Choleraesuis]
MLKKIKILMACLLFITFFAKAENIIIGPGSGIIWSGSPYSINPSYIYTVSGTVPRHAVGFGFTSGMADSCGANSNILTTLQGLVGYQITKGIYLMPRAVISGTAWNLQGKYGPMGLRRFSGTIGYPNTQLLDTDTNEAWELLANSWCFRKYLANSSTQPFQANISGDWIVYADGTQVPSNTIYTSPDIKAFLTVGFGGNNFSLLTNLTFKVVGIECLVNTQTNVNFGDAVYDVTPDAELSSVSSPFSVNCKQGSLPANVNINASFKANTGIFNANNTQLALTQGGGYITGEIGNGITGSGACAAHPTAVNFAQVPVKLTTMLATDPSADFNSTITWRLCSGGAALPVGNINASAELSIVFS